ncbi:unnamed protein product [Soboliphyme baturini]|uniref:Uncharacterized protein n=1 Tax=Soboliphyme baturini TaxID=241478 RepID=A0A183ITH7_9BILA|nr:unnamed protein product [Soboliphyme baturini]
MAGHGRMRATVPSSQVSQRLSGACYVAPCRDTSCKKAHRRSVAMTRGHVQSGGTCSCHKNAIRTSLNFLERKMIISRVIAKVGYGKEAALRVSTPPRVAVEVKRDEMRSHVTGMHPRV